MKNLAGCDDSDIWASAELARAGIEILVGGEPYGEPRTRVVGRLGAIEFRRAWRYWIAKGLVPLDVAKRLYEHPVGKVDVRVKGHCGCPPPDERPAYYDGDERVFVDPDGSEEASYDAYIASGLLPAEGKPRFVKSADGLSAFVESYHIDSEAGLRLFADAVKGEQR